MKQINEGFESHVSMVLSDAGFVEGRDFSWYEGLNVANAEAAERILQHLQGELRGTPAVYDPEQKKILFGRQWDRSQVTMPNESIKKQGAELANAAYKKALGAINGASS